MAIEYLLLPGTVLGTREKHITFFLECSHITFFLGVGDRWQG